VVVYAVHPPADLDTTIGTVRLLGVGAPGRGCPSRGARVALGRLVGARLVVQADSAPSHALSRDGAHLAWAWSGRRLVNAALVRAGAAYAPPGFPADHTVELTRAEAARRACTKGAPR
jgi:endonuclease YncB( thermonuclease family)